MDRNLWEKNYDFFYRPKPIPRLTIPDMLHLSARMRPDKEATSFYGSTITFRELRKQSIKFANALAAMGVQKGDRVAIQLPNCPQFIIAYFGTVMLGGIAVLVNPLYTATELKHAVEITGPQVFITFDMVLNNVKAVVQEAGISHVIVTKVTDYIKGFKVSSAQDLGLGQGWYHFSETLERETNEKLPIVQLVPEDPALIVFTGGTTGSPKGALHTHFNIVGASFVTMELGNYMIDNMSAEKRCNIAAIPFFHIAGHIQCFTWGIFKGATMHLVPRFDIEEFIKLLSGIDQVTYFFCVPTLLTALVNHPRFKELDLDRRLGLICSGGGPCPVDLINKMKEMGLYYIEGWGMTETAGIGISTPVLGLKKIGSIGIPSIESEVKIVDLVKGKKEVPLGEPGELLFKSPFVMKEYYNNPKETEEMMKDGWIHTGDVVIMDEDGYMYIVDRKKDMVIASGYNVYPREIDEVLATNPKIKGAVAVGIPDEYRGETVKAYVVLKEGETSTPEEIIEFCKKHLASYKVPKSVEFRKELPYSAAGKVLRKILRQEEMDKLNAKSK